MIRWSSVRVDTYTYIHIDTYIGVHTMPHPKPYPVLPSLNDSYKYAVIDITRHKRTGRAISYRLLLETNDLELAREWNAEHTSSYIQYNIAAIEQENTYRAQIADCIHTGKPTYYNGRVQDITTAMVVTHGYCVDKSYNVVGRSTQLW
jgi:hypothetical protein